MTKYITAVVVSILGSPKTFRSMVLIFLGAVVLQLSFIVGGGIFF